MAGNPDFTRKSLSNSAKLLVEEDAHEVRYNHLLSLEKEGQMFRNTSSDASEVWGKALMLLLDEERKFALNSALDILRHNANLHLWRKRHLPHLWRATDTHPRPQHVPSNTNNQEI